MTEHFRKGAARPLRGATLLTALSRSTKNRNASVSCDVSLVSLDSQLDPVECVDEGFGCKEVLGEFVVAGGDAPPILDAENLG